MMLARLSVLVVCLVVHAAAQGPEPGPPGPTPGAGCSSATEKKGCGKEKGCVWCEGSFGPGSCYDEAQAKFLPKQFFKCKKPKKAVSLPQPAATADPNPGPTPGAGCSSAMEKKDCGKEKGCVWCEGGFGPGSCYDEAQAKFLPKQFYKCKKPKAVAAAGTAEQDPQGAAAGGSLGEGCVSMTKEACEAVSGCVWCDCSIKGRTKCYAEAEAKFLPSKFFKCIESKPAAA